MLSCIRPKTRGAYTHLARPLLDRTQNKARQVQQQRQTRGQAHFNDIYKDKEKNMGVSGLRLIDQEEDGCLFPLIRNLNVITSDRNHTFTAPSHRVLKLIRMGAINRQISTQYCHYLAHLVRTTEDPQDKEYYARCCGDLMRYLLKSSQDLPQITRNDLLCDIADTGKENCIEVGLTMLGDGVKNLPAMNPKQYASLFRSLLKYGLYSKAQQLLRLGNFKMLTTRICEPLVDGIKLAAEEYKKLPEHPLSEKQGLRSMVIETIFLFCEISAQNRIQFITKQRHDLIRALSDLEISVQVNPYIKMSGRCTACDTHLPLFDNKSLQGLNEAIKRLIFKGADKGLLLNSSPDDTVDFGQFLQKLFERDRRPIDCVIDGLNIAYRTSTGLMQYKQNFQISGGITQGRKVPKTVTQAHTLINTMIRGNILKQYKKILVVGRSHMRVWPDLMEFFHKNDVHFYAFHDSTKDDLFQLYASTLSPRTVLITNDFLRDHLFAIAESGVAARKLLERWIDTHQVWICHKTLTPIMPTPYEKLPLCDRQRGIFHLPVIDFHRLELVGVSEPPLHLNRKSLAWLCCTTNARKTGEEKASPSEQQIE